MADPDQEVRGRGRGVGSTLKRELLSGIGIGPRHTPLVQGKKGFSNEFHSGFNSLAID